MNKTIRNREESSMFKQKS